ncbi:MAG: terminase small subunit [Bilifractor sp.]
MPRNLYPDGKPPRFKSPKAMQEKVDEYFKWCDGEELRDPDSDELLLDKYGHPIIIHSHPYTMAGLAKYLGFKSYTSFVKYKVKGQAYKDVFNSAKLRVMQYMEERLYDRDGSNGARFALQCNFKDEYGSTPEGGSTPVINIMCDIPKSGQALPDQPDSMDTPMPVNPNETADDKESKDESAADG